MSAADLLGAISFHDSVVNRITFHPESHELRLVIELGNYNQSTYDVARDPETVPGDLVFRGISELAVEPERALAPWSLDMDGEIITLDTERHVDGNFHVKLVVVLTDYRSRINETFLIRFKAADATWQPGSTSSS